MQVYYFIIIALQRVTTNYIDYITLMLELYQMKWGVRLHLPRNLYVGALACRGSDDVHMEKCGVAQEVGSNPGPSNSSTDNVQEQLLKPLAKFVRHWIEFVRQSQSLCLQNLKNASQTLRVTSQVYEVLVK